MATTEGGGDVKESEGKPVTVVVMIHVMTEGGEGVVDEGTR